MSEIMEIKEILQDTLTRIDKMHQEMEELKTSLRRQINTIEEKEKLSSESIRETLDVQNMPTIYYRRINYPLSNEAYFWYGKDWADNDVQKVQKHYGKDIDVFHVPNPKDKSDEFILTPLNVKVNDIISENKLISDYVWTDMDDVLLFPDKNNNAFTFDMFIEEMMKEGICFMPEPEFFRN